MRSLTTPTFLLLVTWLAFALCAWAQQKPLTQDQVQSLIRSGLGGKSGAKAIGQSEIDFVPAEDFRQSLKAAGAREAFLKALRTARLPEGLSASERGVVTCSAGAVKPPRLLASNSCLSPFTHHFSPYTVLPPSCSPAAPVLLTPDSSLCPSSLFLALAERCFSRSHGDAPYSRTGRQRFKACFFNDLARPLQRHKI